MVYYVSRAARETGKKQVITSMNVSCIILVPLSLTFQ